MKIKTAAGGQIWRATGVIIASEDRKRRKVIEKGELVEFRYWSPACVRTKDGLYLRIEERDFYCGFEFVGEILNDVNFRNQNTTAEILDAKLYTEERVES